MSVARSLALRDLGPLEQPLLARDASLAARCFKANLPPPRTSVSKSFGKNPPFGPRNRLVPGKRRMAHGPQTVRARVQCIGRRAAVGNQAKVALLCGVHFGECAV